MKHQGAKIFVALAFITTSTLFNAAHAQRVGVSTNVLELAMLAPNVSAELTLGGQSSMVASLSLDAEAKLASDLYFQQMRVGYEYRRWFRQALFGHYCGINASYSNVKLCAFNKAYDVEQLALGLTYGYSVVLGKRWNLVPSIGAGVGMLTNNRTHKKSIIPTVTDLAVRIQYVIK